jgi:hypothetical protein
VRLHHVGGAPPARRGAANAQSRHKLPMQKGSTRSTCRAPQPFSLREISVTSAPPRSIAGSARATKRSAPPNGL